MTSKENNRSPVFISYSRRDTLIADRLRGSLIEHGVDAYLDKHDIAKGEPWRDRLHGLIQAADAVVFLISPDSVQSEVCDWEINEAERLGKRILPVMARPTAEENVPGRLKRLNYTFLDDDTKWHSELPGLVEALLADAVWVREHTRIGEAAFRWDNQGRPGRLLLRGSDIRKAENWRAQRQPTAPELSALHEQFIQESRGGSDRRSRFWFGGLLAVVVTTASLSVLALVMRQQAVESQLLAELRADRLSIEATALDALDKIDSLDAHVGAASALEAWLDSQELMLEKAPLSVRKAIVRAYIKSRETLRISLDDQPTGLMRGDGAGVLSTLRHDGVSWVISKDGSPNFKQPASLLVDGDDWSSDLNLGWTAPDFGDHTIRYDFDEAPSARSTTHGRELAVTDELLSGYQNYVVGASGEILAIDRNGGWLFGVSGGTPKPIVGPVSDEAKIVSSSADLSVVLLKLDDRLRAFRQKEGRLEEIEIAPEADVETSEHGVVSEDGSTIVFHEPGEYIQFIDALTGRNQTLGGVAARHASIDYPAVRRDGSAFAFVTGADGSTPNSEMLVEVWSRSGVRILDPTPLTNVSDTIFSDDGKTLFVAEYITQDVRAFDLTPFAMVSHIDDILFSVSVCPDQSRIAVMGDEGVYILDLQRGNEVAKLVLSSEDFSFEVICADRNRLVVEGIDETFELVEEMGSWVRKPTDFGPAVPLAVGPAGEVYTFDEASGRVYRTDAGVPRRALTELKPHLVDYVETSGITPDGSTLFFAGSGAAATVNLTSSPLSGAVIGAEVFDDESVFAFVFHQTADLMIGTVAGERWRVFDHGGQLRGFFTDAHDPLTTAIVELKRSGELVSGGFDGSIVLWSEALEKVLDPLVLFDEIVGDVDIERWGTSGFVASYATGSIVAVELDEAVLAKRLCDRLSEAAASPSLRDSLVKVVERCTTYFVGPTTNDAPVN